MNQAPKGTSAWRTEARSNCFGIETMKEASVSRVTWEPVAVVPWSIDYRCFSQESVYSKLFRCYKGFASRHRAPGPAHTGPAATRLSRSSSRAGLMSHPEVRRGAMRRRGVEWERPHTFSWCSAFADDVEWMSGKSRNRLAPVLTEASSWTSDRSAQ